MAGAKQCRRFLEHMDDHFITQMIKESMKEGTLLDLTLKQGRTGWVHKSRRHSWIQ